jgi:hypothetical protein
LKGTGGYAVAAPSIHPNKKRYEWDGIEGAKALRHVPQCPAWLLERIAKERRGHAKGETAGGAESWSEGERNTKLASLAGNLRRNGLSVEKILTALLAVNETCCRPPLPKKEVEKIARNMGRYTPEPSEHSAAINIDDLEPDIKTLNAMSLFAGKIQFESIRRRGQITQARFVNGREAIWRTMADLTTFGRSQIVLFESTGYLIPTPPARKIRPTWDPIAQLIHRIANRDQSLSGSDLKEEFADVLRATWERAGQPTIDPNDRRTFVEILKECAAHVRDPKSTPPRCCVWTAEGSAWIHQPSLLEWLSTPLAKNKHYSWGEAKEALFLLDFIPCPNLHRAFEGKSAKANVWRGPLDLLVDDETENAQ